MLLTAHVLTGATIGHAISNPAAAISIAAASHLAIDAIPHGALSSNMHTWLTIAALDVTVAAIITTLAALRAPARKARIVAAAAIAATLLDLDKPFRILLGIDIWPDIVNTIHTGIQHESPAGWLIEATTISVLAITVALLTTRSATTPTRTSAAAQQISAVTNPTSTGPSRP